MTLLLKRVIGHNTIFKERVREKAYKEAHATPLKGQSHEIFFHSTAPSGPI